MIKKIILTKRDIKMLKLIWRLKVCSTNYLASMFFPKANQVTAYNRLNLLQRGGFIRVRSSKDLKDRFWQIEKRGFNVIKDDLTYLKDMGFKSESPVHDHKVGVVQFGIFDFIDDENVSIITEQELRCYDPEVLPDGVPKFGRRSDGYWIFQSSNLESKIVSLEVELSRKTEQQYSDIMTFYDLHDDISLVLWVLENKALANRISSHVRTTSQDNVNKQIFISFDDFIKHGTKASIISGAHIGVSLEDMLVQQGANKVMPSVCEGMTQALASTNIKG